MGLAPFKFRQPIEINYWKNARKGKRFEDYSLCVPGNKKKSNKSNT